MIVGLDTNVLVSALLSPFGNPARVLDLVLIGELHMAYDDRVLTEYRTVLARPRFGFRSDDVDNLLGHIEAEGFGLTARPLSAALPDADDIPFLEVAAMAGAVLVTGNQRHFPLDACGEVTVVTPAEFMSSWREGSSE